MARTPCRSMKAIASERSLGCPLDVLPRLWLCEQPRTEQFSADVHRIAALLGIQLEPLAQIITEAVHSR
jgi:hypothetical protein